MRNALTSSSLLPYLHGTGAVLDFPLVSEHLRDLEKHTYPFIILNDTDQAARLIRARFLADGNTVLKRSFALVQRDLYPVNRDVFSTVSNSDIEEAWQCAFSFYRTSQKASGFLTLCPEDERGRPMPLAPLFFCKKQRCYFHPLCPVCGAPLGLCKDDQYLIDAGCAPYSHSLKRYLWCESPGCRGNSGFYIYERAHDDPSSVKDWRDLVGAFSSLNHALNPNLPCSQCDDRKLCYGYKRLRQSRMAPFSFYPFYMFLFDDLCVNALDFSFLLSAAAPEEIVADLKTRRETGRASCVEESCKSRHTGFLFDNKRGFPFEILCLKLSLLAEIVDHMGEAHFPAQPNSSLSLDRVWIKLADQNRLLPSFWTFTVHPVDIFWSFSNRQGSSRLFQSHFYYLALAWYVVLVANKHQGIKEIQVLIHDLIEKGEADGPFEEVLKKYYPPAFQPAHIFYDGSARTEPVFEDAYLTLWEKVLALGWSLLSAASKGSTAWSKAQFLEMLEALREEVHAHLFDPPALPAIVTANPAVSSDTIHHLLRTIIAKWSRAGEEAAAVGADPMDAEESKEPMDAVIPSSEMNPEKPPPMWESSQDDFVKTVVISVSTGERTKQPSPVNGAAVFVPTDEHPEGDDMDKTMLINTAELRTDRASEKEPNGKKAGQSVDEDMEATRIISLRDYETVRGRD